MRTEHLDWSANFRRQPLVRQPPREGTPNIRTRIDPGLVMLCQLELRVRTEEWLPLDCRLADIPPSLRRHARPAEGGGVLLRRYAALIWVDGVAARCGRYAMARASTLVDEGARVAQRINELED